MHYQTTLGLNLLKSHLGHVCVHRSVCEFSVHCMFAHMHYIHISAGYYYTCKYCTYQDLSG